MKSVLILLGIGLLGLVGVGCEHEHHHARGVYYPEPYAYPAGGYYGPGGYYGHDRDWDRDHREHERWEREHGDR